MSSQSSSPTPSGSRSFDVVLTNEERRLLQIISATSPEHLSLTRRCKCLLLKEKGYSILQISKTLSCSRQSIYSWLTDYLDHGIDYLLSKEARDPKTVQFPQSYGEKPLTDAEIDTVRSIAFGNTAEESAMLLGLTLSAFRARVRQIHVKLSSRNLPHMVALAMQVGVLENVPNKIEQEIERGEEYAWTKRRWDEL